MSFNKIERIICTRIKSTESDLRKQFPILNYQDFLCMLIFFASVAGICLTSHLYLHHEMNLINSFLSIISIAIFTSLLHELEHDLIHNLYFRKFPIVQDFFFLIIWFLKLHGNPWFRRELHLTHHIVSGQKVDSEERLIGLGLPLGFTRMAVSIHLAGGVLVQEDVRKDAKDLNIARMNFTSIPTYFISMTISKMYITHLILQHFVPTQFLSSTTLFSLYYSFSTSIFWCYLHPITILWIVPNVLRQCCLVLMSSCSHYYEDIPEKSIYFQNQVLDHWLLIPFNLLCFNFGATHILHHYVPAQPFYLRQMVFSDPRVRKEMRENGIRWNDLNTLGRRNHYHFHSSSHSNDHQKSLIKGDGSGESNIKGLSKDNDDPSHSFNDNHTSSIFSSSSIVPFCYLTLLLSLPLYMFIDVWVTFKVFRRIYLKYIVKVEGIE